MPINPASSTFKEGGILPKNYSCDGSDVVYEGFLNGVGHHHGRFRFTWRGLVR